MMRPDPTTEPKRPFRETWGMEVLIALSAIATFVALLGIGVWILYWVMTPSVGKQPDADQDPVVTKFRRVGFEIGRNADGEIQVITTPHQPLLVTDEDLAMITGLQHLQKLDLRGTQISDDALKYLTDLPQIEWLEIGGSVKTDTEPTLFHSRFTDAAAEPISELSSLKVLSLAKTDIGDRAVELLPKLDKLEVLFLLGTNVTDDCVGALSQMTSLQELHLQETRVTPEGLARLREALPDTKILPLATDEPAP